MSTMSTPIPAIIRTSSCPVNEVGDLFHGRRQPERDRPGDDAVPDVELLDLRDPEDGDDVADVETVAPVDLEPDGSAERRRRPDFRQFRLVLPRGERLAERPG